MYKLTKYYTIAKKIDENSAKLLAEHHARIAFHVGVKGIHFNQFRTPEPIFHISQLTRRL
jgi:hypothetical protein